MRQQRTKINCPARTGQPLSAIGHRYPATTLSAAGPHPLCGERAQTAGDFCPAFADRIVQQWLVNHIEPTLEKRFIDDTYACRKGKGALAAIEKVQRHMRQPHHHYFLQLDIHSYFNSIPREGLATCWHTILHHTPLSAVRRELLRQVGAKIFLYDASRHPYTVSGARALLKHIPPHKQLCFRGATHGIPIGSLTSQMLANFYLHPLDLFIKHELKVKGYVRYMDDLMLMAAPPPSSTSGARRLKPFLPTNWGCSCTPSNSSCSRCQKGPTIWATGCLPITAGYCRAPATLSNNGWRGLTNCCNPAING
ncbi:reverse transcriptase domain-containing protein [Aeromonas veronii]